MKKHGVRERQAQEARGKSEIDTLLPINPAVGSVGIKCDPDRAVRGIEEGGDNLPDMVGSGCVRTGRTAHHGAEHVVKNADVGASFRLAYIHRPPRVSIGDIPLLYLVCRHHILLFKKGLSPIEFNQLFNR
jgi:hypothetical protein